MALPPNGDTEKLSDRLRGPLAPTRTKRVAILTWTDSLGPHEETIDGPTTVGSSKTGKIVITDPSVSRVHCEIDPGERGVTVRDLGSTNGTESGVWEIFHARARNDVVLRIGRVELTVHRATETVESPLWPKREFARLVGGSEIMRGLFEQIYEIAPSDLTVMIQGETGTGKELVAEAIHHFSKRRIKPFVVLDCSLLKGTLVDTRLFGQSRGAFTGAVEAKEGAFESANGGTIFLDEVGELPLETQASLLRALEARAICRVGETEYRPVDVRVVCASHRDLREMVNRGEFREDLYFRLAVVALRVPALRERLEDVPLIAEAILRRGGHDTSIPDDVTAVLMNRTWPGNVRELRNLVETAAKVGWHRAFALEAGRATPSLPPGGAPLASPASPPDPSARFRGGYREARDRWESEGEREYLVWLMARHPGDIYDAAAEAGIHHTTLRKRLKEHGL